ncbi:MAG: hypothetical protein QE271_05975 [Bacteriovoracaceae bacterium]|nr:hypothetical protein [Bacteriovoracaceae bacterium]
MKFLILFILIFTANVSILTNCYATLMAQWFPNIQWKCFPKKFDSAKKSVFWDGECESMKDSQAPRWRLTISDNKWSSQIGEKISGEILFIGLKNSVNFETLNLNTTLSFKHKSDIWYTTRANSLSTYFVGGVSLLSLRPSKNIPAMKIYGLGMGVGLQSNKNLTVDFKYLPGSLNTFKNNTNIRTVIRTVSK